MHPLITAHLRLAQWDLIAPVPWGMYRPQWVRHRQEILDFIAELQTCFY